MSRSPIPLMGAAHLADVEFENGVIEVDIAVTGPLENCADLDFVPETGLLVIPGFTGNTVRAYRVGD